MKREYVKISKFLSFLLRHHPEKFDLELDEMGFASLPTVLEILNDRYGELGLGTITERTLRDLIARSDKLRFEIREDEIRALYGHRIDVKVEMKEASSVPPRLFHGTTRRAFQKIKKEGLKKRGRQYVHLSEDVESARQVGKRRSTQPVILIVDTARASEQGITFYKSGDMFLADYIPPELITKREH